MPGRERECGFYGPITIGCMQIRMTHSARDQFQQHFTWTWLWHGNLPDRKRGRKPVDNSCFHSFGDHSLASSASFERLWLSPNACARRLTVALVVQSSLMVNHSDHKFETRIVGFSL